MGSFDPSQFFKKEVCMSHFDGIWLLLSVWLGKEAQVGKEGEGISQYPILSVSSSTGRPDAKCGQGICQAAGLTLLA
jgi:hypothetical protein